MSDIKWIAQKKGFEDIRYEKAAGIAKITIARPEVRNAFRPQTVKELGFAFLDAREDPEVGVVILTGEGPDAFFNEVYFRGPLMVSPEDRDKILTQDVRDRIAAMRKEAAGLAAVLKKFPDPGKVEAG